MRIITGAAKGRRLTGAEGTRPVTDRVREAVFSAIGAWVVGADVLDLYAGSGSYGLEALSRGAASATFVEKGRRAIAALQQNIDGVGLGGRIVAQDVDGFLASPGSVNYHLVFIDPPWDLPTAVLDGRLALLDSLLEPEAEVVVSRRDGDADPSPPDQWVVAADRRYGDARIHRYVKRDINTENAEGRYQP